MRKRNRTPVCERIEYIPVSIASGVSAYHVYLQMPKLPEFHEVFPYKVRENQVRIFDW